MARRGTEHTCVFGLGWGDEGKGKIVDMLCSGFDVVVRFNGGANAGHTVCVGDETFALHLLPAGVLHENVISVIGAGVVVDPIKLLEEIDAIEARGINVATRLRISDRAHLVLPYHKLEDQLGEAAARGGERIGTTARGIGPCYADKMKRKSAVRFADLLYEKDLSERVGRIVDARRVMLTALYGEDGGLDNSSVASVIDTARSRLGSRICDTAALLETAMGAGKTVLFEGANGLLLDVDHGTYPFVTSSSTGPHGIGSGAGVSPDRVSCRVGVVKAYATRVGAGPFVAELDDAVGEKIRQRGKEFGTTTGRPRRCGWFDAVATAHAARLGGVTDVALMHLDTLSGFDRVGICTAYEIDGERVTTVPSHATMLERAVPVFEYMPGWHDNLRPVREFEQLPAAARAYIDRVESLVGAPVTIAGVGPDRAQTLRRGRMIDVANASEPSRS